MTSARALQPKSAEGLTYLGLRLTIQGEMQSLQQVLYDFESTTPLLFVERTASRLDDRAGGRRDRGPPKPVTLPDKIRLLGVFLQSEEWKALIELPPQPAQWFKVGDQIEAWTIAKIEENRVVLDHSVRSATLPLYSDGARK